MSTNNETKASKEDKDKIKEEKNSQINDNSAKNNKVVESEKRLNELKIEISEKEQYLNTIKKEISTQEFNNNQTNDKSNNKLDDRIAYRDKQIEILKKELDEKNLQIKALGNNEKIIENLKSENENLKKSTVKDKTVSKNDNEKVIEDLKKENESLNKEISNKNNELKKLNEKLIEKEGEILSKNEIKSKEINSKDINVDLKRSLIEKDVELNNLKVEHEKLKKQLITGDTDEIVKKNIQDIKHKDLIIDQLDTKKDELEKNLNQVIEEKEKLNQKVREHENGLKEEKLRVKELENRLKTHETIIEEKVENIKSLNEENKKLSNKISKMKLNIKEIHEKFEEEMHKRVDIQEKNRQEQNMKMDILEKKNEELNTKMNNLNKIKEQSKTIKKQISDVFQEKVELEEIVIHQEERITNLEKKMKIIDEMLKNKNLEIKKNEQHCMSLIKIIEDQKKTITSLNHRLNNLFQNDIESNKKTIYEKDQEIHFLKNFTNSLKTQISSKDEKIKSLKIKNTNLRAENEKLKNLIKSDNTFSKDHYIKNSSELIFDNSMEKDNLITKKTLDPLELNPITTHSKDKHKLRDEISENRNGKKNSNNKNFKVTEKKLIDDEDIINDSHLKDITVMMKKILDDI